MKLKKQTLTVSIETEYAKSVISKVKNMMWSKFEINPNVVNFSFDDAPFQEVCFYYVATDEVDKMLRGKIAFGFGEVLAVVA